VAAIGVVSTIILLLLATAAGAQATSELRWGGDTEGGAPFAEADPNDPTRLVGFDVEIAELIARDLGRIPRFVFVTFTSIDQSVVRGDFDIGLSGIEDTPARRAALAVTIPYYEFREVLTVREADRGRYRRLEDLRGRRVGTLAGELLGWPVEVGGKVLYSTLSGSENELRLVASMPKGALAGGIVLCPPSALNDRWSRRLPDPITAMASGWMRVSHGRTAGMRCFTSGWECRP